MNPLEIIRQAQADTLIDVDGLENGFHIIDLRRAKPGCGFSWGRYGPKTQIKRFGTHAVFAYKEPKSLISWLLGRAG